MSSLRHRSSARQRWSWLLWLALILPFAQATATWHAYSHVESQAGGHAGGKHGAGLAHCDLCLKAAALSGGALVDEPAAMPRVAVRHAVPADRVASVWPALAPLAYRSRAPPISAR